MDLSALIQINRAPQEPVAPLGHHKAVECLQRLVLRRDRTQLANAVEKRCRRRCVLVLKALIASYAEVESGKRVQRPELAKALAY